MGETKVPWLWADEVGERGAFRQMNWKVIVVVTMVSRSQQLGQAAR